MFKILSDPKADNKQLAEAFQQIEQKLKWLNTQKEIEYQKLVKLQQSELSGENVTKDLKKSKDSHFDLELKITACSDALDQIRERMVDQTPAEIKSKIVAANQIFETILDNEKKLTRKKSTKSSNSLPA